MDNVVLKIKKLNESAIIPEYKTIGSSGLDLSANITSPINIKASEIALIPTGLVFEIPEGYEVQIRPRSGLALKHGITVLNTPGTIDSDYRGEVKIILINLSKNNFEVNPNERIAQAVVQKVHQVHIKEEKQLSETIRSDGGFGHTGS